MAEEKKEDKREGKEKEKEEEGKKESTETPKKKKLSIKFALIIGAGVLVLACGGFLVWNFFLAPNNVLSFGGSKDLSKTGKIDEPGKSFPLESFIVNLADEDESKYAKVSMELELSNEKTAEELNKRIPQIRDCVLTLVSSHNYRELQKLKGKYVLKSELISRLNKIIKTGQIKNIYFTEFVIQ